MTLVFYGLRRYCTFQEEYIQVVGSTVNEAESILISIYWLGERATYVTGYTFSKICVLMFLPARKGKTFTSSCITCIAVIRVLRRMMWYVWYAFWMCYQVLHALMTRVAKASMQCLHVDSICLTYRVGRCDLVASLIKLACALCAPLPSSANSASEF